LNGSTLSIALWCGAAAIGVVYAALFLLTRRQVAIRLVRVASALLIVPALRLALLALGYSMEATWEGVLTGVAIGASLCLCLARRAWIVRVTPGEFHAQVQEGCRGLFLGCEEPAPGQFVLTAKEGTWTLRLRRISDGIQLVVLSRPPAHGKIALFMHWLSKQYPGPVPRVRVILYRSES
jgi:hypothetical protein